MSPGDVLIACSFVGLISVLLTIHFTSRYNRNPKNRLAPGLVSVAEHNREQRQTYGLKAPRCTGVGCPLCGAELCEAGRGNYATDPPTFKAACSNCGYAVDLIA